MPELHFSELLSLKPSQPPSARVAWGNDHHGFLPFDKQIIEMNLGMVLRLGRLPCGKPLAFRQARDCFGGYAAEAKPLSLKRQTESRRLSARAAAKPRPEFHFVIRSSKTSRNVARDSVCLAMSSVGGTVGNQGDD